MAGNFLSSFEQAFTPAYQSSLSRWQQQENADREFGLRKTESDARLRIANEAHAADMKERGLRLQTAQNIEAARGGLRELLANGEMVNTGLGLATEPEYDASAVQRMPASDRSINAAQMRLAVEQGQDINPYLTEGKRIDARFAFGKNRVDPAARAAQMAELNRSGELPFTVAPIIDEKTKKETGYHQMHIVGKDGKAQSIKVSDADLDTALWGKALLDRGLTEDGLRVLQGVNSSLAQRVQEMVRTNADVVKTNNTAQHSLNQDDLKRQGLAMQGQHYRDMKSRWDAANKQLDPADVKKLNDMVVSIQGETDPTKRAKMMQDFRVAEAAAMSKIGKTVGIPEPKVNEMKVNPDGSVVHNNVLYIPDPKNPGKYKPAQGLGPSATDRALAAFGAGQESAPNPTTKPPLANPTLDQLRAMSDEALGLYSANPVARALARERAIQASGGLPTPDMNMDRGY